MPSRRLPALLAISALLFVTCSAQASSIRKPPKHSTGSPYLQPGGIRGIAGVLLPSSPDDWLGGVGNWSNGAGWSTGLPASNSDVSINTGNDNVTLDTSSSINSLVLGGTTGSSRLTGDGNAHTLTIAGALTVNQSGNLYLSANTVTAGANSTNAGTIDLEYASALQVHGDLNNSGNLYAGLSYTSLGSALTVTGTLTNSGAISIGYSLGTGSATVGGLSNTGSINLAGGSVMQVNGNAANAGGIYLAQPSEFSVNGNLVNSGVLAEMITDENCCASVLVTGTLTNTTSGSFTIGGEVANGHLGALVNQGQVLLSGELGSVNLQVDGNATNSGTITVGEAEGEEQLSIGGTLTNSAGGQLNVYSYGDQITVGNLINSGSISLNHDVETLAVSGTLANNLGGSVVLYGFQDKTTMGSLSNSGSVDLENQSTLEVNGDVTNSGQLTTSYGYRGGSTISIAGKLTNNAGGTFSLGAASDLANIGHITNAGTVSIASGAALNVGGANAPTNALPGFVNTGIVNVAHGGTVTSGLTYVQTAGQTTVDGTLRVFGRFAKVNFAGGSVYGNQGTIQGPITSNAAINIGDSLMTVGELSFVGNYTQGANGSLTFDIGGTSPGQYDQLNVSGRAQLNGLMTVDLLHGFVPQIGNTFDIMNFASESGTFSMVVGLPINGQEHFVLDYNSTNLTLDVVTGQLSGPDTRGESASLFASEPFVTPTDGNGYLLAAANNGGASPTPEPSSILLLGTGIVGLAVLLRRRRH